MGSIAQFTAGEFPRARSARTADEAFFIRLSTGLALFILFGFAQFEARGLAPLNQFPWVVHAHAATMVAWIGVTVVQPRLLRHPNLRVLHRRLGWLSIALLVLIPVFGSRTGIAAVRLGFVPPFFTPAYFLALVHVGVFAFVGLVVWAVALRKRTDWHGRLMVGSTVVLMEPALGRLLPMPLLGSSGEWLALAVQLGALGILARHDRRSLGRVHPATLASGAVVIAVHVTVELLATFPPLQALAASLATA